MSSEAMEIRQFLRSQSSKSGAKMVEHCDPAIPKPDALVSIVANAGATALGWVLPQFEIFGTGFFNSSSSGAPAQVPRSWELDLPSPHQRQVMLVPSAPALLAEYPHQ